MTFKLSQKSLDRLTGVHPDLVDVVMLAIGKSEVDFCVLEGVRSMARQEQLVKAGASKTMKSRHLTGHAVDLGAMLGGSVRWDWGLYMKVAESMKEASEELAVPIRWGGAWKLLSELDAPITSEMLSRSFPDGPHFELPIKEYPA